MIVVRVAIMSMVAVIMVPMLVVLVVTTSIILVVMPIVVVQVLRVGIACIHVLCVHGFSIRLLIGALACHFPHCLIPPRVIPSMNSLWAMKKSRITGSAMVNDAAIK
jgi:hypothetical protein